MKKNIAFDGRNQPVGFSLIEVSIALLLISAVSGFALLSFNGMMPGMNANTAMYQAMAQLRVGREQAIAQRRNYQVAFVGDNQIQLRRVEEPAGAGTTILSTVTLDNNVQFRQFDGIPDTPDALGNGAALSFGGLDTLTFLSDGILVDAQGSPLSGTVFLGLEDHPETARAVTVLGATGRVRGYRWTGTSWIH